MNQLKEYFLPTPQADKYFKSPIDPTYLIPAKFCATNYFVDRYMDRFRDEFDLQETELLKKKKMWSRIHRNIISYVLLFYALHWVVLLIFDLNHDTRLKLGDITFLAGGLTIFTLIAFTSYFLLGALIYRALNITPHDKNSSKKYVWRYLFDVLRGVRPPVDIGLGKNWPLKNTFFNNFFQNL